MSDLFGLWGIFLGTFIGLLPIVDPLTAAPAFLAITEGRSAQQRHEQARRGCIYMVAILVSFLVGGRFIMSFFGISLPGLRITGGILLTGLGMKMLDPPPAGEDSEERDARPLAGRSRGTMRVRATARWLRRRTTTEERSHGVDQT